MQPLTNLLPSEYLKIAEEVKVPLANLVKAISLFEEGATIPFLARYRKDVTGNMDEDRLRLLQERLAYFRELEERRQAVLRSIEEQGKLTTELRAKIEAILDKNEMEDLCLPFKPKRKGRASEACEKGFGPLAEWLWAQQADGGTPESLAESFVNAEKAVESAAQALAGARDILAERISDNAEFRKALRQKTREEGVVIARKSEKADELAAQPKEPRSKYEMYYDFSEPVAKIPSHRLLAIRRGVKEGYLHAEIKVDDARLIEHILSRVVRDPASVFAPQLEAAAGDGYHRLLKPSIQNEVRQELKERADVEAIRVFQENLRSLLLAAPAGPIVVMGIDPGSQAGCQAAVVDGTGKHLESAIVFPHEPKNHAEGSRAVLKDLIARHNVRAVAIGNGNGSRETDLFVRALIRDEKLENVFSIVLNEAGLAVYSGSRLAREEFPELDTRVRGAISLARRLQDPLAELVKIDPQAIGVGQYQHDVDQKRLEEGLHATVEGCVNRLGADLNSASIALLRYVSGLNERVAKRIVEFRQKSGPFQSRAQLKEVPGFGDRIFEQAAGFVRVNGQNPLDRTAVHPQSYPAVEKMAASLGVSVEELTSRPELPDQLKLEEFETGTVGPLTLNDIREELRKPGVDPREKFVPPRYRDDVLQISDLKEGMEREGVVTNVTDFGAFVDVGVAQDGLVHVSELSAKFIKDPREAVKVGDIVKVRVLAADAQGKRISLSMKPARPPKVEKPAKLGPSRPQDREVPKKPRQQGDGRPPRRASEPAPQAEKAAAGKPAVEKPGAEKQAEAAKPSPQARPKQSRPPQPKEKPLSFEEKLALLQSKFRTRV